MTWPTFLAELESHKSVTLVGPLHSSEHSPWQPTIYVDGGARFRPPGQLKVPVITLGDGDSGGPMDETLPQEKDYSDLAFVLRELPRHVVRAELLGFLGGRRDHELANLGELHHFLKNRETSVTEMKSLGKQRILGFCGALQIDIHGIFSLFVLEAAAVTVQGQCKYKLEGSQVLEPASSHGLSNEGSGLVMLQSPRPCFIFLNEVS